MKHRIVLALVAPLLLLIAGCAGSPLSLASMDPAQLATQSDASLAQAYGAVRNSGVRAEIERRKLFTSREWSLIESNGVAVGMSELALLASKGLPTIYGGVNETVTATGTNRQYVYRATTYNKPAYVYVENGRVTAYQH